MQYEEYQESLLTYIEVKEVVRTAEEDGRKKREVEIAEEMKKNGESILKIMKYTGLSKEEIDEL
jgi:predicted transposase YdaD